MDTVLEQIAAAHSIVVYQDGKKSEFVAGDKYFKLLLATWKNMTAKAVCMPAFGVSIDELTRKQMQSGVWIEFRFREASECDGLPFEALLMQVGRGWRGCNLIRLWEGKYFGRCFYIDLGMGTMDDLMNKIQQIDRLVD